MMDVEAKHNSGINSDHVLVRCNESKGGIGGKKGRVKHETQIGICKRRGHTHSIQATEGTRDWKKGAREIERVAGEVYQKKQVRKPKDYIREET